VKGDRLQGLAQAHVVGQHASHAQLGQTGHPRHAAGLVVAQVGLKAGDVQPGCGLLVGKVGQSAGPSNQFRGRNHVGFGCMQVLERQSTQPGTLGFAQLVPQPGHDVGHRRTDGDLRPPLPQLGCDLFGHTHPAVGRADQRPPSGQELVEFVCAQLPPVHVGPPPRVAQFLHAEGARRWRAQFDAYLHGGEVCVLGPEQLDARPLQLVGGLDQRVELFVGQLGVGGVIHRRQLRGHQPVGAGA